MNRLLNTLRRDPANFFRWANLVASLVFVIFFGLIILGSSSPVMAGSVQQARAYTRSVEFDFPGWMINALFYKINQVSLGTEQFISPEDRHQLVLDYLQLVLDEARLEYQVEIIYADPNVDDAETASADLRRELDDVKERQEQLQPVAEAILQSQISEVVSELGLTLGGQPIPPILYHATPLPKALIISPREVIRQDADISLTPDLSLTQIERLEQTVDSQLDVSSLVVDIGGVGVYPTMVYESNNLEWLSEVVSHEWIHNFLTMRPLGLNYLTSPETRTMNETTASIAGKEIGRIVLERYYPELVPPPPPPQEEVAPAPEGEPAQVPAEPVFDFRKEMHTTRVTTDALLAGGQIEQAEEYMEQRRVFFWENGYRIRKLNQAYFAFYGAYADVPGGAAGEDPVGEAVRELRARSQSLTEFIKRIAWMSSFEQLQRAVE